MVRFALVQLAVAFIGAITAAVVPTRSQPGSSLVERLAVLDRSASLKWSPRGYTTNAKRLAAGLPPLPPKRNRIPANLKPRTSAALVASGTLVIRRTLDGTVLGRDEGRHATIANNGLRYNNLQFGPDGPYRVGIVLDDADTVGAGSPSFITYNDDESTNLVSTPEVYPYLYGYVRETSVWAYTPPANPGDPGRLTFVWTNPDGTPVECQMYEFYDASGTQTIIATPDIDATLGAVKPASYYELDITLE